MFQELTLLNFIISIPLLIMVYVELVLVLLPSLKADDRLEKDSELRKKYFLHGWLQVIDSVATVAFLAGLVVYFFKGDPQYYQYGFNLIQGVAIVWLVRFVLFSKKINFTVK